MKNAEHWYIKVFSLGPWNVFPSEYAKLLPRAVCALLQVHESRIWEGAKHSSAQNTDPDLPLSVLLSSLCLFPSFLVSLGLDISGHISLNTRQFTFYRRKVGPAMVVWADGRSWWEEGDNCSVIKITGILFSFRVSPLLSSLWYEAPAPWGFYRMMTWLSNGQQLPLSVHLPCNAHGGHNFLSSVLMISLCSTFQKTLRHFARVIFLFSQSLRTCGLISTILTSLVGFRELDERNKACVSC